MKRHHEVAHPRIPGERLLHAPGPTHIPAEVLNAMHQQPMDHGDPRLDAIIGNVEAGIPRLLHTSAGLLLHTTHRRRGWGAGPPKPRPPPAGAVGSAAAHLSARCGPA